MYEHITQYFKNITWTPKSILTTIALSAIGFVVLALALVIIGTVFRVVFAGGSRTYSDMGMSAPSAMPMPFGGMGDDGVTYEDASYAPAYDAPFVESETSMGFANVAKRASIALPQMLISESVNGSRNSEKYQQEGYSASYETRHLKETCEKIEALKPLDYVLFDSATQGDESCYYNFRVEKARTEEVVTTLKALGPKDWTINIQTVAQNIENTEDRVAMLERRLAIVEDTLNEVERAYKNVISVATQNGKVGELSSLVTQKLAMVERLSNEKLSIEEQIRQFTGGKDDQIEETTYSHFSVSVQQWEVVGWQGIKEQWKQSFRSTIYDISTTLAYIVLTLPTLLLSLAWYGLVIFIVLIALVYFVKHTWALMKKVWETS